MSVELVYGIVKGIHSLASFFWVGSLLFLTLVLIPKSKTLGEKEGKEFMDGVFDKLTPLVIVSIIVLAVFGIISRKLKASTGELTSSFKTIHLVKIVLTGIMVLIAIFRQSMRKRMKKMQLSVEGQKLPGAGRDENTPGMVKKGKRSYALVYINTVIGSIIVLLSGIISVV